MRSYKVASNRIHNKFVNAPNPNNEDPSASLWQISRAYFTAERQGREPESQIPVLPIQPAQLDKQHNSIFRLGHSTVLMQLDGKLILTDPVFSYRASPFQWMGPKRFHQSPISTEALPDIDVVVISHDHYDHLDKSAINILKDKVKKFVTPLGVGQHLVRWGVSSGNIIELDWWQSVTIDGINFVATPAQHFSGRGLRDGNKTLWASWVIQSSNKSVFFSGDSGYFDGFKQIGDEYGPFDITLIETGAYNDMWSSVHMMPEQSLQAHLDLGGHHMLPIHNGTFDLSFHTWFEPLERILALANENNVSLLTPKFGQEVTLDRSLETSRWWREMLEIRVRENLTAAEL
ncbi:MBL fold metallo-hydrolase [Vibrio sp. S4M6]|uniref:MBL fold metallo-hydrolase n=1 Tax=Vibrio sinus TaxID=2946865 RepID=UPI00202AAA64|nr:MBL fold metallo-hydrolase [Vibrio sinus]MCL9780701.1 MBL fold metallo-hydrolase [Vibrio sinus]